MKQYPPWIILVAIASLVVSACSSGSPTTRTDSVPARSDPSGSAAQPTAPRIDRTLVMMSSGEPASFATKQIVPSGAATGKGTEAKVVLNAALAFLDERGLPYPVLAESLPQLNSGDWRVFPDGKMETIYHLKPNLTWHDGQPLTAEDFVFAWRVYAVPDHGVANSAGFKFIEEVTAPDPRTVHIRWKGPYTGAGGVDGTVFSPLPRHLLEQPFQTLAADPFLSLPFWTSEYVGAGPWKLSRNEPGAFFEATAFDGFVFGRPKIDRVRVTYVPDSNTAVANMLSGNSHYVIESLLFGEEGLVLEQQWGPGGGTVLWESILGRVLDFQYRPEYAVPQQLATDVRVRQAVAYAIDKEATMAAVTAGKGILRDVFTHPDADYYNEVIRSVSTQVRYDPRRAEQLLLDAGFTRGADGFWAGPTGQRFTLEQWYIGSTTNERESHILVDSWRRFGIDASSHLWGVQRTSNEDRSKTSGVFAGAGHNDGYATYHSSLIPRPETRWTGGNRLGFTTPEFDRLIDAYDTALDRTQRIQHIVQMERMVAEGMNAIVLYYSPRVIAHVPNLKGVVKNLIPEAGPERRIWQWEWQA
jgi:peptide/nickel transport system substrate-binding protein